jgi:colanic acid/amylovoran biosynthesis glycosyltransferase
VGHVMRAYLAPTESFVYNQVTSLRRYRPVVVAHHARPRTEFPRREGAIAQECLPPRLARVERLAYRLARVALSPGQEAITRYLRARDTRLLHYHYLTDARFLLEVRRRTGLAAIVSGYGYDVNEFPHQWRRLGRRYLRPLFDELDCFLAMTEDMRQDMLALGCPDAKVDIHYHGSDTARFRCDERRYETDGPLTVLCCGRLYPGKGQHLVLRALRRLEQRGRARFRVVIVGDGPARADIERLIAAYGWRERAVLTGHLPHAGEALVEHFRQADIFAGPSMTVNGAKEGVPGTLVEAMAAGLPVVSTRHGGIPFVIESGRHGLLVEERDVDALAEALDALLVDPGLRRRLGRAAAEHAARELDLGPCTRRLERIYDRFV